MKTVVIVKKECGWGWSGKMACTCIMAKYFRKPIGDPDEAMKEAKVFTHTRSNAINKFDTNTATHCHKKIIEKLAEKLQIKVVIKNQKENK